MRPCFVTLNFVSNLKIFNLKHFKQSVGTLLVCILTLSFIRESSLITGDEFSDRLRLNGDWCIFIEPHSTYARPTESLLCHGKGFNGNFWPSSKPRLTALLQLGFTKCHERIVWESLAVRHKTKTSAARIHSRIRQSTPTDQRSSSNRWHAITFQRALQHWILSRLATPLNIGLDFEKERNLTKTGNSISIGKYLDRLTPSLFYVTHL